MRAGSEYKQISEAYTRVYTEVDNPDIESPEIGYTPGTEVGLAGLVTPGRIGKGILKIFSPIWKAEIALDIAAGTRTSLTADVWGEGGAFESSNFPAGGQFGDPPREPPAGRGEWPLGGYRKYWIDKKHRAYYDAASVPEKVEYLKHHAQLYGNVDPIAPADRDLEELTAAATRDHRGPSQLRPPIIHGGKHPADAYADSPEESRGAYDPETHKPGDVLPPHPDRPDEIPPILGDQGRVEPQSEVHAGRIIPVEGDPPEPPEPLRLEPRRFEDDKHFGGMTLTPKSRKTTGGGAEKSGNKRVGYRKYNPPPDVMTQARTDHARNVEAEDKARRMTQARTDNARKAGVKDPATATAATPTPAPAPATATSPNWGGALLATGLGALGIIGGKMIWDLFTKKEEAEKVKKTAPEEHKKRGGEEAVIVPPSAESLEKANKGEGFLFDEVTEVARADGAKIKSAKDVLDYINNYGKWKTGYTDLGPMVVKVGT